MRERAAVAADPATDPVEASLCVSPGEWQTFVDAHPEASGYHAWEWRGIFERAFGHETLYLAAHGPAGLRGVLPLVAMESRLFGRFMVSLPFVNYGGVLASDDGAAQALVDRAFELARARRYSHVELRHRVRRFPVLPVRSHKAAMCLTLPADHDSAWGAFDRKLRNQIRKADKSGLRVDVGGSELLPVFYRVFSTNMRDLGTPVYGRRLFDEALGRLKPTPRVVVIGRAERPLAAGIMVRHRDTVEMPWAASVRDGRAWCANQMLYWTAIRTAIDDGARWFDFGRSTVGDSHFLFKRQWGAVATPLQWEYLLDGEMPDFSPTKATYRTAVAVWKQLPVPIATFAGPYIVRSIP